MSKFPLLLEPEELAKWLHQPGVLLVDLGKAETYAQAHVPGAVHLDWRQLLSSNPQIPGLLPEKAHLSRVLSGLGLTPDSWVVAYDDEGGTRAARFLWILDTLGHQHYSFLNGGIHAWLAAELPHQVEAALPVPSQYEVSAYRPDTWVDADFLLQHYQDDDLLIWDARTAEEYSGERVSAQRGGHIPGAVNYDWTRALNLPQDYRLRDLDVIRAELDALGIVQADQVVTHCQTHHRSSFTWLLAKMLGLQQVRGYPGSWSEWGNRTDTPVKATAQP